MLYVFSADYHGLMFNVKWVFTPFFHLLGSCYSPADFTSEELDSVQPSASWKETESNPQSGSRYHRKGHNCLMCNKKKKYKQLGS